MLILAGLGSGAQAHAILVDSQPEPGATLAAGPTHIELRFNSRIDGHLSRVELRQPGHAPLALPLTATADGRLVTDARLPPGAVTLRWQVLAVDGHITRGDIPLTVSVP